MRRGVPLTRELVLIGGGHAHALVLRKWGMNPLPGARLTLVNPDVMAPYTGMLPGYVAGHYVRAALDIDLVRLARHAGARLIVDAATGIDRANKRVMLSCRPDIAYDTLSIDIGVTSILPDIQGFQDHAVAAKPLGVFASRWDELAASVAHGQVPPAIAVIGAGVAGGELALAMHHRLRALSGINPKVTLLEAAPTAVSELGTLARRPLMAALAAGGITIRTEASVAQITSSHVTLSTGEPIAADFTVSAAGARPHAWLAETGLALTDGYINVDKTLRSATDPDIFAVGDCAHLTHAPRPKAGVFAVREAPVLHDNLRAALAGTALRAYHPQKDYLKLVSLGDKRAIAMKWGVALTGRTLWRWKDRIDRAFMDQFTDYPAMKRAPDPSPRALPEAGSDHPGPDPLCGGCGAKVGRADLLSALETLPAPARADVVTGPGDDAAILDIGGQHQVITTDHVRAFTEDPWRLARIAAIHALGDVWAMGGAPQAVLASITVPDMSSRLQSNMVRELMLGASSALREAGGDIVGGHTSIGAELSIGFTVTGLLDQTAVGQGGAGPGDAIVLTKPIGSGAILAGEMRGLARGVDVETALQSMARSQARASALLAPHATAMTDVTGFGLAGHLMAMLETSNCAAALSLQAIPIYPGALELSRQGVRSTLWPANAAIDKRMARTSSALSDLLFDPQTAGGLLATVPASAIDEVVASFREAREPITVIGSILDGAPFITVL